MARKIGGKTTFPVVATLPLTGTIGEAYTLSTDGLTYVWAGTSYVPASGIPPIPSLESYGHSWPDGFGNSNRKYNYPYRVAKALGVTLTNIAQSGADFADSDYYGGVSRIMRNAVLAPEATTGPYVTKGGLKLTHPPSNDGTVHGTTANPSAMVERGYNTALAALCAARYIMPGSASITLNTMSSNADLTATLNGTYLYCTANASYVQVALDAKYNQEAICVVLPNYALFPCTATATVTRDPTGANVTVATYSAGVADNAVLAASVRNAPLGIMIPAGTLPAGANTLRITYTGLTGPNYGTFAGVIICGNGPIAVVKYPRRNPDAVIAGGTGVDTLFQWGNARATAVMANFPNAFFVETDSAVSPKWTGSTGAGPSADESNYWFDNAHPNDNGAGRIAGNILRAVRANVTHAQTGAMNEIPITPSGPTNSVKDAVRVASTANLSLAPGGTTLTIDGVALNQDDRILLKDQTTQSQNGIYVARGIGLSVALRRADDAVSSSLMAGDHVVTVGSEGAVNGNSTWMSATPSIIVLDTTSIVYRRIDDTDTWRSLWMGAGSVVASAPLGIYPMRDDGAATAVTTTLVAAHSDFHLDPTQYAITGKTIQIRVVGRIRTSSTAPGTTFTFAVYPINSVANHVATLGAAVATAAIVTPALNTQTAAYSTAITMPTGHYLLACALTGANAAVSVPHLAAEVQVRKI